MSKDLTEVSTTSVAVADQVDKFIKGEGVKITLTVLPIQHEEEQKIYVDIKQELFPTQSNVLANRIGALLGEYIKGTVPAVLSQITRQAALDAGIYERVEDDGEQQPADDDIPSASDSLH